MTLRLPKLYFKLIFQTVLNRFRCGKRMLITQKKRIGETPLRKHPMTKTQEPKPQSETITNQTELRQEQTTKQASSLLKRFLA